MCEHNAFQIRHLLSPHWSPAVIVHKQSGPRSVVKGFQNLKNWKCFWLKWKLWALRTVILGGSHFNKMNFIPQKRRVFRSFSGYRGILISTKNAWRMRNVHCLTNFFYRLKNIFTEFANTNTQRSFAVLALITKLW